MESNIVKVIVWELPENCRECEFLSLYFYPQNFTTEKRALGGCIFLKRAVMEPEERLGECPLYPMSSLYNIFEELAKGDEE